MIGVIDNKYGIGRSGLLEQSEVEALKTIGAAGNICTSFFSCDGSVCETSFEDRVLGVWLDDIKRAEHSILVATGISTVEAIIRALGGGIVNTLEIDYQTAKMIIEPV